MRLPALIRNAKGSVDGVNCIFLTDVPYLVGTTVVFLNGFSLENSVDNGWTELGGNKVKLKEAPVPGDKVQIYYRPAQP